MNIRNGSFITKEMPFSQVSNCALRDGALSLKAKGLYSLIQSYITIPNFILHKSFLMSQCKEGSRAFESAWKELKDNGYLKQYRSPCGRNNAFMYWYELLDTPDLSTPSTINLSSGGDVLNCDDSAVSPPPTKCTTCETDVMPNGRHAKEGSYNNTEINNTDKINTYMTESVEETVKSQIGYDSLIEEHSGEHELIDTVVATMAEVLGGKRKNYKVEGRTVSGDEVRQNFRNLTRRHIDIVLSKLRKVKDSIKNLKAYLLVCLYKASGENIEYLPCPASVREKTAKASPASYDLNIYNDMLKNRRLVEKYGQL